MEHGIKREIKTGGKLPWVVSTFILFALLIGIWIQEVRVAQINAEASRMMGKLGQIRAILENFETVNGYPLPRLTQSNDGRMVSWREQLVPYLHDIHDNQEHPELLTHEAPDWYRVWSDSSDPTWTSIVAVYDPNNEGDGSQRNWAVVAMAETGIPWRSARDMTVAELAEILARRETHRHPIAVLSASGTIGSFRDGGVATYDIAREEKLRKFLFP